MGDIIMSGVVPQLVAPKEPGIALADIAEGGIVKLNENGSPVEFYVAKHDYESALNGTGRTLLVRKGCYKEGVWQNPYKNDYATSSVNSELNTTYKALLDADVQNAIGATKFYYSKYADFGIATLSRSVFILSVTELGKTVSMANVEGSALPSASVLQIAEFDGAAATQWTRSPYTGSGTHVFYLDTSGSAGNEFSNNDRGIRPCFTLPATAIFDEETLLFKEVS